MAIAPGAGILDVNGLGRLREAARDNSPQAIRAAATHFEALFLDMVMKSMREAAPADSMFDSEQGKMMQGMLDQQYAQALASRGIGLADVLARQMTPKGMTADVQPPLPAASSPSSEFSERLAAHAQAASAATGIPAKFMLAQAALESGWGRREIRNADGSSSHNVFGIKAGRGWDGKVAEVMTTEYIDGVAHQRREKFRAYGSYAEAFADYARMLSGSPRYREAIAATDGHGFADALQKAGYATDPLYAQKLKRVMAKV